jgi:RimK family alpha-L-glutamate ligase
MNLLFLLVRRVPPVPSPVLVAVEERLRARGHRVDTVIPEETVVRSDEIDVAHDLYVLKSHTELALSLAAALEARGGRVLNPHAHCVSAQDKVVSMLRLRAAGVPVPRTWVATDPSLIGDGLSDGPVIIKPHRGHRGAGVILVRDEADLANLSTSDAPLVIQDHIEGPGEDLKVYVVGEQVFAVRKPFSAESFTVPGRPCRVTREVRDLALRAGEAFGLGLFGLDVIESPDGPVVVDLNYFPGYKGVPGVAPLIADYIDGYARSAHPLAMVA